MRSVCYVVPHYSANDHSHFSHLPAFIAALERHCKVFVIVERSADGPEFPGAEVFAQRYADWFRALRIAEFCVLVVRLYRRGCRRFFVRISLGAAITAGILSWFIPIQVYYWNSGQSKNVFRPPAGLAGLGQALRTSLRSLPFLIASRLVYRFVTGPESMVEYYAREYGVNPERTIVLYNDVDVTRFQPPSPRQADGFGRRMSLLYAHRLSPIRGPQYLVTLAQRICSQFDVVLNVVGDGPYRQELETAIAAAGLTGSFVLAGSLPNRLLPPYYWDADVFLLPSEGEGFPRVVLEAMAAGRPIVSFDVGGVRDLLGPQQREFLVPRGDIEAFASRVSTLLAAPELRWSLSQENRESVQRFNTPAVAALFAERIVNA